MLQKFFRQDKDVKEFEIPLYTEFTGKKRITPFRNTSCLSPLCMKLYI